MIDFKKHLFELVNGRLRRSVGRMLRKYFFESSVFSINMLKCPRKMGKIQSVKRAMNKSSEPFAIFFGGIANKIRRGIPKKLHHPTGIFNNGFSVSPGNGGR